MNLNEQLQQAYEAGRRQGLNEQSKGSRIRNIFIGPQPKPYQDLHNPYGIDFGTAKPRPKPNSIRKPTNISLPELQNWRDMIGAGVAPSWWTGTFDEFMRLFSDLTNVVRSSLRPAGSMSVLDPLFNDFVDVLMDVLYNPGQSLYAPGGPMGLLLQNPLFKQLFDQGWQFRIVDGNLQFLWNHTPGKPGGSGLVPNAYRPDLPLIPQGDLGMLGRLLSEFFNDNPFSVKI